MARKLSKVPDWQELAKRHGYRVGEVARELGISVRCLEKYFKKKIGKTPHNFFAELRAREIVAMARSGTPGEQIAKEVGFANRCNLSRYVGLYLGEKIKNLRG